MYPYLGKPAGVAWLAKRLRASSQSCRERRGNPLLRRSATLFRSSFVIWRRQIMRNIEPTCFKKTCLGHPGSNRINVRWLERSQKQFKVDERPKDLFVICTSFDVPINKPPNNSAVANPIELRGFAQQRLADKLAVGPSKPFIDRYAEPNFSARQNFAGQDLVHCGPQDDFASGLANQKFIRKASHHRRQFNVHERHAALD